MNELLDLLYQVTSRLESAGIPYMVTGSMASATYAQPRMTRDIDIIIQVTVADAVKIITLFRDDFYLDETTIRETISCQGMFNIIHRGTIIKIDFVVRKNEEYRREEFSRRRREIVGEKPVWMVAPEDLILSKLLWVKDSESELQFRDVRQLLLAVKDMNRDYLHTWSVRLGVAHLLEKAMAHE